MANRKDLPIIRAARAGQAAAQLRLGKHYLFGSEGLRRNLPTALYWLDRAARQDEADAWMLIGRHVPFETVLQAARPRELCIWYERAFDAGVLQAGFVMARLVLGPAGGEISDFMRAKALKALQVSAHAGIANAQWLLAQHLQPQAEPSSAAFDSRAVTAAAAAISPTPARRQEDVLRRQAVSPKIENEATLEWMGRAAQNGVLQAQYALADHAWAFADHVTFLRWALPLARQLAGRIEALQAAAGSASMRRFREHDVSLLSRSAQALFIAGDFAASEIARFWECAAQGGDRIAQYSLGLWFARMDGKGRRIAAIPGVANYKKSVRWLSLAAGQGLVDACYALSRIYLKPECSQRNLAEAKRYLEQAAQAGHGEAQLELGIAAWRTRRDQMTRDVQAAYWLQQAAAQGIAEAQRMLDKVAVSAGPAAWAQRALKRMSRDAAGMYPLLVARVELAASFGLSRIEALLIDPKEADRGHCLAVDIRARHPHGRRRLIRLRTAEDRRTLDRILRLFEKPGTMQEGNYRQRLYRLKALTSEDEREGKSGGGAGSGL